MDSLVSATFDPKDSDAVLFMAGNDNSILFPNNLIHWIAGYSMKYVNWNNQTSSLPSCLMTCIVVHMYIGHVQCRTVTGNCSKS